MLEHKDGTPVYIETTCRQVLGTAMLSTVKIIDQADYEDLFETPENGLS